MQPASLGSIVKTLIPIRWGSFVSKQLSLAAAVDEAVSDIMESIGQDSAPELAIVFVTSTFGPEFDQLVPLLRAKVPSLKHIFGCSVGFGCSLAHALSISEAGVCR